jgi:hypothetical protein
MSCIGLEMTKPELIGIFCAAVDLAHSGKSREQIIEILTFLFERESQKEIEEALDALGDRGVINEDCTPADIEKSTPTAERMRNYRERKRNALRNGSVTSDVTHESGDGNALRIDQTRPEEKERKTPLPPKPVTVDNSVSGKEGFSRMGDLVGRLVGQGQIRAFDVRDHLHDDDYVEIGQYMQGWDRKLLFDKYNAFVANDPPRSPKIAFIGWVKKFTKGKRP